MFSPKFILRVLEILVLVVVSGALLVAAYFVINRAFRAVVDYYRYETSDFAIWLRARLPKFPERGKRKKKKAP